MRHLRALSAAVAVALLLTACTTDADSEAAESTVAEPTVVVDGPLARCIDVEPSEPEVPTRMRIEPIAQRGDEITATWDFADPNELLRKDLVVDCWTEDGWDSAWISLNVFGDNPSAVVLGPDDEAMARDEGFGSRVGVVVVPDEAPDGYYRARTDDDAAIFQVRTN